MIRHICIFTLLCLLSYENRSDGAKILGMFHQPSKSYYVLEAALLKALAQRGHEVTLISPFKLDEPVPNFKEIVINTTMTTFISEKLKAMADPNVSTIRKQVMIIDALHIFSSSMWDNQEVQELIKSKEKFDVAITIPIFSDSILGLSHHLGAANIFFSPVGSIFLTSKYVNNPITPYLANKMFPLSDETSFCGRLRVVMSTALAMLYGKWYVHPQQQKLLDKHIPNSPSIEELVQNVSLVLSNSHYSIEPPQPTVPNYIPIGGFYSTKPKELPKDLKTYLDEAKSGAVLFCFGSNFQVVSMEKSKLDAILSGLKKIAPVRVLFKSEIDIPNLPHNVIVQKWIPQNDVLAHPNIKGFITHAGLGGMTEALSNGVPTLAIPLWGDQENNAIEGMKLGTTVTLKINDLNENSFSAALHELISNQKYAENARLRAQLMKDQPIDPLEHAIYWVEHVIKYKGAPHLRNAGMKLTWYQNYMVDIILFVFAVLLVFFSILFYIALICVKKLYKILCKESKLKKN